MGRVGACLAAILLALSVTLVHASRKDIRVAVVGGGMAGLGAAARLQKAGVHVTLFEAAKRLGGRVYPIKHGNGYLQLGAEFLNGRNSSLFRIAEKLDVVGEKSGDYDMYKSTNYRTGETCRIPDDFIRDFHSWADNLETAWTQLAQNPQADPSQSLGELFTKGYNTFIEAREKKNRRLYDAMAEAYGTYWQSEWAAEFKNLAMDNLIRWSDNDADSDGSSSYRLKGHGFHAILRYLTDQISSDAVRLESRVTHIKHDEDKVEIEVDYKPVGDKFDYVIVTSPVGHLRRYYENLFEPPLEKDKTEALDQIGFGHFAKLFLVYRSPWWLRHSQNGTSWLTPRVPNCMLKTAEFQYFLLQLEAHPYFDDVLVYHISGRGPRLLDKMGDPELADLVTETLQEAFDDDDVPEPVRMHRYSWANDRLIGGSYSSLTVDATKRADGKNVHEILARPSGRVRFAGEHTHASAFQTTFGAHESGEREADAILAEVDGGAARTSRPEL